MSLADLHNRHEGLPVMICGTGPSLDDLEVDPDSPTPRIYLNRAALCLPATPGCTYMMTLDDLWGRREPGDWDGLLARIRSGESGLTGVWPARLYAGLPVMGQSYADAPTGDNIVTYTGPPEGPGAQRHQPEILELTREQVVAGDRLYTFCGSAMTAIHLAWVMGAREVLLAGIDGTDGYAPACRTHYGDRDAKGGFGYGQAKVCALDTAAALGLPLRDLSVGQTRPTVPHPETVAP